MILILDGEKITDREELHKQMEAVLNFPEWYGGNLDALYDCLTELTEEVDIHILHLHSLEENLGDYVKKLIRMLKDAELANLNVQIVVD